MPPPVAAQPLAALPLSWQWTRMSDLAAVELYAVMVARQTVFAVEQQCAYLDADGLDPDAWHLLGWDASPAPRALAGYLRVIDPGRKYAEPAIGRVLTTPAYRSIGLGRVLMRAGLARTAQVFPGQAVRIAAQQRLEAFYASLGFRTVSAPFLEDGIPHVEMLRAADTAGTRSDA
jgi:ElaA protein